MVEKLRPQKFKPLPAVKSLKSALFKGSPRIQKAASVPFKSIKYGERDMAVQYLMMVLRDIERHSSALPNSLMPRPSGPFGPPGTHWGTFRLEPDIYSSNLTNSGEYSISLFQKQAGNLEVDGKAGMETIQRLDEIQFYLESNGLLK